MSIRLRLALWYGALCGVMLMLVSLITYAIHTRAHYDDLDRVIVQTTEHVADEANQGASSPQLAELPVNPIAPDVLVRAYHSDGTPLIATDVLNGLTIVPASILADPAGPPVDRVARFAPAIVDVRSGGGTFSIVTDASNQRWRLYLLPIPATDDYLVSATPLGRLDASVGRFRALVTILSLAGAGATVLAGLLLAERALRPVSALTTTASRIARVRGFDQRVPVSNPYDELGRMETTFNEMLQSLEHAYRAQQRFVSDASHELRAPMTIIQANLDFVAQRPDLPASEREDALREASREVHRLTRLIGDLLALARADAGVELRFAPVEFDRVVLDALSDARRLTRGQQLRVDAIEPVAVQGDVDRLRQLMLILLDNAIKYTPPPGSVTLTLRRDGTQVAVVVRDQGVGIPPDDLPHVFDRFYRADPARSRDPGGSGLGLPIARWIAEQHGGEVTLTSQLGGGTTATVRLPLQTAL